MPEQRCLPQLRWLAALQGVRREETFIIMIYIDLMEKFQHNMPARDPVAHMQQNHRNNEK